MERAVARDICDGLKPRVAQQRRRLEHQPHRVARGKCGRFFVGGDGFHFHIAHRLGLADETKDRQQRGELIRECRAILAREIVGKIHAAVPNDIHGLSIVMGARMHHLPREQLALGFVAVATVGAAVFRVDGCAHSQFARGPGPPKLGKHLPVVFVLPVHTKGGRGEAGIFILKQHGLAAVGHVAIAPARGDDGERHGLRACAARNSRRPCVAKSSKWSRPRNGSSAPPAVASPSDFAPSHCVTKSAGKNCAAASRTLPLTSVPGSSGAPVRKSRVTAASIPKPPGPELFASTGPRRVSVSLRTCSAFIGARSPRVPRCDTRTRYRHWKNTRGCRQAPRRLPPESHRRLSQNDRGGAGSPRSRPACRG